MENNEKAALIEVENIDFTLSVIRKTDEQQLRITVLENWKEEMQVEMVNRLLDQVTDRLNKDIDFHLPRIGRLCHEFEAL
jgi:hypothetical protein